jgi:hypothetical protein
MHIFVALPASCTAICRAVTDVDCFPLCVQVLLHTTYGTDTICVVQSIHGVLADLTDVPVVGVQQPERALPLVRSNVQPDLMVRAPVVILDSVVLIPGNRGVVQPNSVVPDNMEFRVGCRGNVHAAQAASVARRARRAAQSQAARQALLARRRQRYAAQRERARMQQSVDVQQQVQAAECARVDPLLTEPTMDPKAWKAPRPDLASDVKDAFVFSRYLEEHLPLHVCAVCGVYHGAADLDRKGTQDCHEFVAS